MKKSIIYVLIFLLTLSLGLASNLDVTCPSSVNAGQTIDCVINLDQNVNGIFGAQFVVSAPGFTAADPFVNPTLNEVSAFNAHGLDGITALLKLTPDLAAGEVAIIHLIAGEVGGSYTVSLIDLIGADGSNQAEVLIDGPSATVSSGGSSSGGSSSGGSSSGGSSSGGSSSGGSSGGSSSSASSGDGGSATTKDTTSTPQISGTFSEAEEALINQAKEIEQTGDTFEKKQGEKGFLWLEVLLGLVVIAIIVLVVIFLQRRKNV